MANPERISPKEAYDRSKSGSLLVCAYEDDEKCRNLHLESAISFSDFKSRSSSLPKDKEIIFYCA